MSREEFSRAVQYFNVNYVDPIKAVECLCYKFFLTRKNDVAIEPGVMETVNGMFAGRRINWIYVRSRIS